jgi:hypothetical protein
MTTFTTLFESTLIRKGALGLAGLAFTGGAIAGPIAGTQSTQPHMTPTAAAVQQTTAKPTTDTLIPHGVQGEQARIPLNADQTNNVKEIIKATKKAGMDERAAVIAIATSLQESKLENLGHLGARNDHDSQGLFQQRPSSGWGTVAQIRDPQYATTAFLNGLKQVNGWRDMPLTQAAQKVQVSAYPDAYAKWEQQAADLVAQHWNNS